METVQPEKGKSALFFIIEQEITERDDFSLKKLNFVGSITKQSKSYSTNNYHCNASKQECLPALSNLGSVFQ